MEGDIVFNEVQTELKRIRDLYRPIHSTHEGYALLLEKFRELEREVFSKPPSWDVVGIREECIQVAAMSIRIILDCCSTDGEVPF